MIKREIVAGADPENSEKGGRVPHPPTPPPQKMKTSLSGHAAYSFVGVFVMQT